MAQWSRLWSGWHCTCLLSAEKATESTSFVWPMKRQVVFPVFRFHSLRVPSQDPDRANCPSLEMTTSCTK